MTRPIYEPNPQRQGASLEFGQQQLYRRPAQPGAAGAGQLPTATMEWPGLATIADNAITTLNNANTGVDWQDGYINDEGLAMTPQPFDFDFTTGRITFRSSGLYHAQLEVNWAATFPTPGPSYLVTRLRYVGDCFLANGCGSWMSTDVMFNEQQWMAPWQTVTALIYSIQDPDNDSSIEGAVIQKSGGGKDLSGAVLKIVRLCSLDPATGSFLP